MKHPILTVLLCLATFNVFAQGNLNPTSAPTNTMKTLAQIEPRTPISSLPYSITTAGSYYLTTNLSLASGPFGISIASNNITLDLGGFTMANTGSAVAGVIFSGGYTNVTLRHGNIVGWQNMGVDAGTTSGTDKGFNLIFEDLRMMNNGNYGFYSTAANEVMRNCQSISNYATGVAFINGTISGCQMLANKSLGLQATDVMISDCIVTGNGSYGIFCTRCDVSKCNIRNNGNQGINANASDVRDSYFLGGVSDGIFSANGSVRNCSISYCNGNGIYVGGNSIISGCHIQFCQLNGIFVNQANAQIIGNFCDHNNATNTGSYAGIYLNDSNNRVEDNHVVGTGANGYAFYIGYTNNIVIKNSAVGNGVRNFYIASAGNDLGPVGTATNSTSPWANISH